MLKGLEVAEVKFAKAYENKDFRIEAEFYISKGLELTKFFLGDKILSLGQYNSTYGLNNSGKGYPILRMNEYDGIFTGIPSMFFESLSEEDFNDLKLKKGDILICRTNGNPKLVGKSAFVAKDVPYIFESHLFKVRVNEDFIKATTVAVYLNCKYGKNEIHKLKMQGNQANFSLAKFKEIKFPKFNFQFNSLIDSQIFLSYSLLEKSNGMFFQLETKLLNLLGLTNWQPSAEGKAVKKFSKSFAVSGRLDAEYYQPKYDELIDKLNVFPMISLNNLVSYPITSGSTPKAGDDSFYTDKENGIPFIRAVDIENSRVSDTDFIYIKPSVHNSMLKKTQLKKNDILFSIAGTVGRLGIYDYDYEANINQACAILRIEERVVSRDYVCLFFNSKIGKLYIEKYARQGLQTNLNLDELGALEIPILPMDTQKELVEKIQQSFKLRQESIRLIEVAKQAVEIAIEQDEAAAMKFIQENT